MTTQTHHYFMLKSSPWPLFSSICSFNMLFSLLFFFKFGDFQCLLYNLMTVCVVTLYWWCTYSGEFNLEGKSSLPLESGLKLSIILFICSEVFFFFSFFWSYFHFFLSPTLEVGLSWPPISVDMFDFTNVPLINTLVLMGSGLTVTISHYSLINNNMKLSNFWLLVTILLGGFFTFLQWEEYCSSFFTMGDGSFGTSFFILTGFHGIHVLVGSLYLSVSLFRSKFISSSSKNFLSFELASWYWHFVDVVWIFLYFLLYYLNY